MRGDPLSICSVSATGEIVARGDRVRDDVGGGERVAWVAGGRRGGPAAGAAAAPADLSSRHSFSRSGIVSGGYAPRSARNASTLARKGPAAIRARSSSLRCSPARGAMFARRRASVSGWAVGVLDIGNSFVAIPPPTPCLRHPPRGVPGSIYPRWSGRGNESQLVAGALCQSRRGGGVAQGEGSRRGEHDIPAPASRRAQVAGRHLIHAAQLSAPCAPFPSPSVGDRGTFASSARARSRP